MPGKGGRCYSYARAFWLCVNPNFLSSDLSSRRTPEKFGTQGFSFCHTEARAR